jgi:hypothetical protein
LLSKNRNETGTGPGLAGKNMQTFAYLEGPEAQAVRASQVVKPNGKSVKPDDDRF